MIEMLVAAMIGLIVVAGAGTVLVAAGHVQPRVEERSAAIQEARFVVDGITRELRQGWAVPAATATQISILTYVKSASCGGAKSTTAIACRVTYSCNAGACTRTEAQLNGSSPGPPKKVVSGLESSNVFTYLPSAAAPTSIGVTIAFPATDGDNAVTLEDGASLRNPIPGAA